MFTFQAVSTCLDDNILITGHLVSANNTQRTKATFIDTLPYQMSNKMITERK